MPDSVVKGPVEVLGRKGIGGQQPAGLPSVAWE